MNRALTHLSIAAVFLVGAIALYVFGYLLVEGAGKRVAEVDGQIAAKRAEVADIRNARSALSTLADSEARVTGYFVPQSEIVEFLEGLEATGAEFGGDVEVVNVTQGEAADGRVPLTLSVRVTGSFAAVMRTVGTIEFAPYDITLTNLSLDSVGEEGGTWAASATYQLGTKAP